MTQKNRATLNSEADAAINDNNLQEVSPADVRGSVKDLADSSVNLTDDVVPASEDPLDHDVDNEVPSMATMIAHVADAIADVAGTVWDSFQPTSNVSTITTTGLGGCRKVEGWFAFTHNSPSSVSYNIEARTAAGTWRTVASFASLADSLSAIAGYFSIADFNQGNAKVAIFQANTNTNVLDASSATNEINTVVKTITALLAWNEVWSEVRITTAGATIEGVVADQRGRWQVRGQ